MDEIKEKVEENETVTQESPEEEKSEEKVVESAKNTVKKNKNKIILVVVVFILGIAAALFAVKSMQPEKQMEILTESSLKEIINVSQLSTFETVYNGVATVYNAEKPEKVDYHVYYESIAKAGVDLEKVSINIDHEAKKVKIDIPDITITDTNVDITSLDFIFINKKAKKEGMSKEAYKFCCEDLEKELAEQNSIYELAEKNAEKIITALTEPFVKQIGEDYTIEFVEANNE